MPTPALSRRNPIRMPARIAFGLAILAIISSEARAQGHGEGLRARYQRFYGQDFYAGGLGYFPHLGPNRVFRGPAYGPAMMYGRQYGEENGYATAPVWVLFPPVITPRSAGD